MKFTTFLAAVVLEGGSWLTAQASEENFDDMPPEVHARINHYLTLKDLGISRQVCNHWNAVIIENTKALNLHAIDSYSSFEIWRYFRDIGINKALPFIVKAFRNLNKLELQSISITAENMKEIVKHLSSIKTLNYHKIDESITRDLATLTNLTSLWIWEGVPDMEKLTSLTKLQTLNINTDF